MCSPNVASEGPSCNILLCNKSYGAGKLFKKPVNNRKSSLLRFFYIIY